jgi:hypothetical protein
MAASSAIDTAAMTLKYKNPGRAKVLNTRYYTKVLCEKSPDGLKPIGLHMKTFLFLPLFY